ncbi:MAG: carbohydrate binding family 9 domain-containing protein [Bacteroidales bacterium]|nr:carbohydrate binding family 9 domain-containing protein [Bacteroidales bacterium]MCF8391869.1 carbohydrate binding family 9 domain-containing protein [Bacteroidales bacterium]
MPILIACFNVNAQESTSEKTDNYSVEKSNSPIRVDGALNEAAWSDATLMKLKYEYLPGDNIPAQVETDFLITFDEKNLYMAFRCYDPDPSKVRAHLMDRDAIGTFVQDDHVVVLIDFFNDERRAFQFRVNPLGVQADAIFSEMDGIEDFSWDAIWESKGSINESGWVAEISIPFNQLRFPKKEEAQTWGIIAERSYPRNVRHRMINHKRERNINGVLSQTDKVSGFQGMKTGLNMEVDPTLTINRTDERVDFPDGNTEKGKLKVDPGISMRWGITPNMILNATVNPDFSQVEADVKQLEVNTRYVVRYPEKRPFFLEGADFFTTPIEAVFTRTVSNPDGGLKFTGKVGKNAIGLFTTHDRVNNLLFPSNEGSLSTSLDQNVLGGVFRFRRDVGKGSAVGLLYTGRNGDTYNNHVAGMDGFFRLSETKTLSVNYLRSETNYPQEIATDFEQNEHPFDGGALSLQFNHQNRNWAYNLSYQDFAPNFRADFGYISRVDIRATSIGLSRNFWGKENSWYDLISIGGYGGGSYNYDGKLTDDDIHAYAVYSGPLQTTFSIIGATKHEVYMGTRYELQQAMVQLEMKPLSGLKLNMMTHFGDMVDYSNLRLAWHMILNPAIQFNLGKHFNMNLQHRYMRMAYEKNEIFTANLSQLNLVYNFNVRAFVRAIIQYQNIRKDQSMYASSVQEENKTIFSQFLFSYKLNPQSVVFIGYSDNYMGYTGIDVLQTDKTFFLKLGYAWLL